MLPGGKDNGTYGASFVSGNYSAEQTASYSACDNCTYSNNGGLTYYCPEENACASFGTDANSLYCGTKKGLLYNACPTTPVTDYSEKKSGVQYKWSLGAITGNEEGRTQNPYLQLDQQKITPLAPITFANYTGHWAVVGQHLASSKFQFGTSWSTSTSNALTNAFQAGLEAAKTKNRFGMVETTKTVSQSFTHTASEVLSHSSGGSYSIKCQSLDCSDGILYQWRLSAIGTRGPVQGNLGAQAITMCSWVCIPDGMPVDTEPVCPNLYCGDSACQCCTGVWRTDTSDPTENKLCNVTSTDAVVPLTSATGKAPTSAAPVSDEYELTGGTTGSASTNKVSSLSTAHEVTATGCQTDLSISIANNLEVPLVARYWVGSYGEVTIPCDSGGSKAYQTRDGSPQSICTWTIDAGNNEEFTAQNSMHGGGICNGGEGRLTLQPPSEYTQTYGLHEVVIWYSHPGGNNNGTYGASFVSGNYSAAEKDWYEDPSNGCYACEYSNSGTKFSTYYCTSNNTCSSGGTDGNVMYCGMDRNLKYNACPTTPVQNQPGASLVWALGDITGDVSGRTQTPYLQINQFATRVDQPVVFDNYQGAWVVMGQHVQSSMLLYGTSWSHTKSNTVTNAWDSGLKGAIKVGFGSNSVSSSLSSSYSRTSSETVSKTSGGSMDLWCTSLDCSDGVLYQWRLLADGSGGNGNIGTQFVTECSWVCVPDALGGIMPKPKCPNLYCGDIACQCCNGNWMLDSDDPVENNVCGATA